MDTQNLTVAQICMFAPALQHCGLSTITWAAAKPYLVEYVRATGIPLAFDPVFPEIEMVNRQALALDKTEALALLDVCYGIEFNSPMFFSFESITFDGGVNALTKWARTTGAMECPEKLKRLCCHARPTAEMIRCYLFVTGARGDGVHIFLFNKYVREFGSDYDHFDMVDGMLRAYDKPDDQPRHIWGPMSDVNEWTLREFCALANKKL